MESHPSTISSCLYKAPRDWFQLIIYFNSYLIKPIHGKEIRSHCTDYLIDPLLNVKFLHLDQFKSPHSLLIPAVFFLRLPSSPASKLLINWGCLYAWRSPKGSDWVERDSNLWTENFFLYLTYQTCWETVILGTKIPVCLFLYSNQLVMTLLFSKIHCYFPLLVPVNQTRCKVKHGKLGQTNIYIF